VPTALDFSDRFSTVTPTLTAVVDRSEILPHTWLIAASLLALSIAIILVALIVKRRTTQKHLNGIVFEVGDHIRLFVSVINA
jgi:hypothetical protein